MLFSVNVTVAMIWSFCSASMWWLFIWTVKYEYNSRHFALLQMEHYKNEIKMCQMWCKFETRSKSLNLHIFKYIASHCVLSCESTLWTLAHLLQHYCLVMSQDALLSLWAAQTAEHAHFTLSETPNSNGRRTCGFLRTHHFNPIKFNQPKTKTQSIHEFSDNTFSACHKLCLHLHRVKMQELHMNFCLDEVNTDVTIKAALIKHY